MLDLLIAANIQYISMLKQLQKVLSKVLKCLCSKTKTVLSVGTVPKPTDVSHIFTALQIN